MIATEGKTVRGARSRGQVAPHLVAALDQGSGAVLGQLCVAAKSNEIPAVRTLLTCFDVAGTIVTVAAMHSSAWLAGWLAGPTSPKPPDIPPTTPPYSA